MRVDCVDEESLMVLVFKECSECLVLLVGDLLESLTLLNICNPLFNLNLLPNWERTWGNRQWRTGSFR